MTKKPRLGHDPFKEEPLSFIRDTRAERPGKPSNISNIENTKTRTRPGKQRGRPKGSGTKGPDKWKRATFIVRRDHLEKIKALAYWERVTATELLDRALETYLKGKEIRKRSK
jgi:hypothetical protein